VIVAGVAIVAAGRVVSVVAEVVGDLALQRGLDQPLRELGQQPALAGQLQPARTGPPDRPRDQLLVDPVQNIRAGVLALPSVIVLPP
jgi:hypothetical protein